MNYIQEAISHYVGRECVVGIDYSLHDIGNGVCIEQWYIQDKAKPTILQLQTIANNLAPSIQLEELKELKMAENQANYDIVSNGVKVINGVPINIDPKSQANLIGEIVAIMSGISTPPIVWMCDNNIEHDYSLEEFSNICAIVFGIITNTQKKLSANKIAIANAKTVEELNAIDLDYNIF